MGSHRVIRSNFLSNIYLQCDKFVIFFSLTSFNISLWFQICYNISQKLLINLIISFCTFSILSHYLVIICVDSDSNINLQQPVLLSLHDFSFTESSILLYSSSSFQIWVNLPRTGFCLSMSLNYFNKLCQSIIFACMMSSA